MFKWLSMHSVLMCLLHFVDVLLRRKFSFSHYSFRFLSNLIFSPTPLPKPFVKPASRRTRPLSNSHSQRFVALDLYALPYSQSRGNAGALLSACILSSLCSSGRCAVISFPEVWLDQSSCVSSRGLALCCVELEIMLFLRLYLPII